MRRNTEPPSAVADSNLYVGATIIRRGSPFSPVEAWRAGLVRLLTSPEQLDELGAALRRPRMRRYGVTEADITSLLHRLSTMADVIAPELGPPVPVRDP